MFAEEYIPGHKKMALLFFVVLFISVHNKIVLHEKMGNQ